MSEALLAANQVGGAIEPRLDPTIVRLLKIRRAAGGICGLVITLLPVLIICAVVAHIPFRIAGPVGLALMAVSAGSGAVVHAFQTWLLFRIGGWKSQRGEWIRRVEQPRRFWPWASLSIALLIFQIAMSVFLLIVAASVALKNPHLVPHGL